MVFLYESLAQLVFAYPARHVSLVPLRNNWLHVAVIGGAALQIATVFFPPLRFLLGLEWLDTAAFAVVGGSVLLSWGFAELLSRRQAGAPTHAG